MMDIFKSKSFDDIYIVIEKNKKLVLSVFVGIGLLSATLFYYASSVYKNNEAAYEALGHLLHETEAAYQNPELWNEIENGTRTALRQFKNTTAKPYLQIILSEALIQQDNVSEGLSLLHEAISRIPAKSPYSGLFAAKSAALQLSSGSEEMEKEGLLRLEELARNKQNKQAAYAQFLLAQYYDEKKQTVKAKELYTMLAHSIEGKPEMEASPFGLIARHRLTTG